MMETGHLNESLINGMFGNVSKSRISFDAASLTISEESKIDPLLTHTHIHNKTSILLLAHSELLKFNQSVAELSQCGESVGSCLNKFDLSKQTNTMESLRKKACHNMDLLKQEIMLSRTSNTHRLTKQLEQLKGDYERKQVEVKELESAMKSLYHQTENISETHKQKDEQFQRSVKQFHSQNCRLEAELAMEGMMAEIERNSEIQDVMSHNKALSERVQYLTDEVSKSRGEQQSLLNRTKNLEQKLRISESSHLRSRSGSVACSSFDTGLMLSGPSESQLQDLMSNFGFYIENIKLRLSNWKQEFRETNQRDPTKQDTLSCNKKFLYNNLTIFTKILELLRMTECSSESSRTLTDIINLPVAHLKLHNLERKYKVLDNEHRNLMEVNRALRQSLINRPEDVSNNKENSKEVEPQTAEFEQLVKKFEKTEHSYRRAKIAFNKAQSELKESQIKQKKLEFELNKERSERRKLHNEVEDLKGNIRIYCRIRPLAAGENKLNININFDTLSIESRKKEHKEYKYDAVFGETSSQEEIFEDTKKLVKSALDGFNVCIFAYGQTGSGKTFTLQGDDSKPGLITKSIEEVFVLAQPLQKYTRVEISLSLLEIYLDNIRDLLDNRETKNQIHEIKQTGLCYVNKSKLVKVGSAKEALEYYTEGIKVRQTSSTLMNEKSSRSHLLLIVYIETENLLSGEKRMSKLSLVDLAGSEGLNKSGLKNSQIEECKFINSSLSALRSVITGLNNRDSHIKYRDSKLTYLLKDSIGGNSKTLMFVNISPSEANEQESVSSLEFANGVKKVLKGIPTVQPVERYVEEPRKSMGKFPRY